MASSGQDGNGSADVGSGVFERHTFLPIIVMALLGLVLAAGAVCSFKQWCAPVLFAGSKAGLCFAIQQSPPWIPLASLASAPSLLLTWYWRTRFKKTDLSLRASELALRNRELAQADEVTKHEREERAWIEVRSAIEALSSRGSKAELALSTIRTGARYPAAADAAIRAICVLLQWTDDDPNTFDEPEEPEERRLRQKAVETLSALRRQSPETPVDLQAASLFCLDLRGLDLRNADLRSANLYQAKLNGALLDGANLVHVRAHEAEIDADSTTEEHGLLRIHGAKVVNGDATESDNPKRTGSEQA